MRMAHGPETTAMPSRKATASEDQTQSGNGNAWTREEKVVGRTLKKAVRLTEDGLNAVNSRQGLLELLLIGRSFRYVG